MKCVTALGLYTITACVYASRQPPRSALLVARQPTLAERHSGHPYTCRLTGHCKRLICNTLAITQYNAYHMEWGFTLLECILTRQNRRQGGRGSSRSWRRRRRRIAPLRFFCANWPLRACVHSSLCYIPLRLARHFPAVRSGWPSPLHRRKCSGLSSCPTPVAWPSLRMAACVHVVPLGAIDEFCGDLVERVPG